MEDSALDSIVQNPPRKTLSLWLLEHTTDNTRAYLEKINALLPKEYDDDVAWVSGDMIELLAVALERLDVLYDLEVPYRFGSERNSSILIVWEDSNLDISATFEVDLLCDFYVWCSHAKGSAGKLLKYDELDDALKFLAQSAPTLLHEKHGGTKQ